MPIECEYCGELFDPKRGAAYCRPLCSQRANRRKSRFLRMVTKLTLPLYIRGLETTIGDNGTEIMELKGKLKKLEQELAYARLQRAASETC